MFGGRLKLEVLSDDYHENGKQQEQYIENEKRDNKGGS